MSSSLARTLAALPQPAPSPEFAKQVRARIARLEPRERPARADDPVWGSRAATVAGAAVTAAAAAALAASDVSQSWLNVAAALAVSAGVSVYVAGLFAAVRTARRV